VKQLSHVRALFVNEQTLIGLISDQSLFDTDSESNLLVFRIAEEILSRTEEIEIETMYLMIRISYQNERLVFDLTAIRLAIVLHSVTCYKRHLRQKRK